LRSYGDVSIKEDVVLNAVEILTARETRIFNMIGVSKAIATVHSYLTDTLKTAASNAQTEAGDYTNLARTTPSRLTNLIQNIAIPFRVSRTQQKVQHYHGEDELNRQTRKALMEWANDAEFVLVRETLTSGVSGTAPKMSKLVVMFRLVYNWIYAKKTSMCRLQKDYFKIQCCPMPTVLY